MAARRLHGLIYATIAFCCLIIAVCALALGTDEWFSSEGVPLNSVQTGLRITVNYGLFKGKKIKHIGVAQNQYDLRVVCQVSDGKCMYSCGANAAARKNELSLLLDGKSPESGDAICQVDTEETSKDMNLLQADASKPEQIFLNFGLYVMTITFLAIAIVFAFFGGALALYNTYRTPIQPVLSVFGLYIWNGISAASVALAMIMWGVAYATELNKNAGISDTLYSTYTSEGRGKLGYSFWILVLPMLFAIANVGIIRYRSWKIVQMEAKNVRVMSEKLDNGDILLF